MNEDNKLPQSVLDKAREAYEIFPEHKDIIFDAFDLMKEELEENPNADELITNRFLDFLSNNIPEIPEDPFHARGLEHHLRKWMHENYPFEGKTGKDWAESTFSKLIEVLNYKIYSPEYNYKDATHLALKFHHQSGEGNAKKELFREAFKYTFEYSDVAKTISNIDQSIVGSLENLQFIKDAVADLLLINPQYIPALSPYAATTATMDTLPNTTIDALSAKIISVAIGEKLSADEWISHNQPLVDLCLSIDTEYQKIFTPSNYSGFSRVHQKYFSNQKHPDPIIDAKSKIRILLEDYATKNPSALASHPNARESVIDGVTDFYLDRTDLHSHPEEVFNEMVEHYNDTLKEIFNTDTLKSSPIQPETQLLIAQEIMKETFIFDTDFTEKRVSDYLVNNPQYVAKDNLKPNL